MTGQPDPLTVRVRRMLTLAQTRKILAANCDFWILLIDRAQPEFEHFSADEKRLLREDFQSIKEVLSDPRVVAAAEKKQCGECHLQPGETCDLCGVTAPALC